MNESVQWKTQPTETESALPLVMIGCQGTVNLSSLIQHLNVVNHSLTPFPFVSLRQLLQYILRTVRSYLLKEDFQFFWEYHSPYWAGVFLDDWCGRVMRSRLEPLKKVARMLRSHRDLILNWFHAKKAFSSGVVEGLNGKAKVTMRNAYGFRTYETLEMALYHSLGALPEPHFTHRFF